ncbi:MAG TPA: hypothetical protein VN939_03325 [Chthoniobacterales bacterium]|nr:hypothetical protein [Chthoniobacterales bacterium]
MKTFLGSLLASTMQAIETGFWAYFTFSERDARILASAYGSPHPEIEDLQDSRPSENESTVSIPSKMKLPQRLTPAYIGGVTHSVSGTMTTILLTGSVQ